MEKQLRSICSFLLVIVMIFNILPINSLAMEIKAEDTSTSISTEITQETTEDVHVLEEITDSRTEFSKEFLLSNGLHMAAVYPNSVHFESNGQWLDIDNTLKVSGNGANAKYTNTAGGWNVNFPQRLNGENDIEVTNDGFTLRFHMAGELNQGSTAVVEDQEESILTDVPEENESTSLSEEAAHSEEAETAIAAEAEETETDVAADAEETETDVAAEAEEAETAAEAEEAETAIAAEAEETESSLATEEAVLSQTEETVSASEPETSSLSAVLANCNISEAQESVAEVQNVDITALKADAQYEELVPETLHSRLVYANVYSQTSVSYDLDSNRVKESLILRQYNDTLLGYRYALDVGRMIPVLEESGKISFYTPDRKDVVMVMPAPFMLDAGGAHTGDVQVLLEGSGSTYTLTYLLPQQWLADSSREWPVILDPVIAADTARENILDQSVFEYSEYDYEWGMLECGYGPNDGKERFFIMYDNLPSLSSADVIVSASMQLYKPHQSNIPLAVEVHKVNGTWTSSTLQWRNQPSHNPTVEDFAVVRDPGYYYWDVTDIVRGWYSGQNTGMVFKGSYEVEEARQTNWKQFYSSDYGYSGKPTLVIQFRNNNGLESYWDYTASSAGRAGTGYINDYTGNLVWIRSDIGFGGNRMPVSINHVYNANDSANNSFGMGYGWRTNFNQRVYQWSSNSNYYIWEDADGTKHYFKYSSSSTYKDEDGLELTLTTNGSGTAKYCITDKYGNKTYFDTYGRLTKQQNNQQTPSSITVTYTTTSGNLISTITDGAGRVYSFTYSSNLLSRISYKGKGSTELSYVSFAYSSSQLTSITDKDGKASTYTYVANHLLASAVDVDGYKLTYSYNTTTSGKPSRVVKVCEYSGSTAGGELTIEYAHNQTSFKDVNGNLQIMQFNNWGNTLSIQDGEGRAQYAQYASNDPSSTAKGNQLTLSSKLQNTVGNVLKDASFENSTTWTNINSSVTHSIASGTAYLGNKALKMVRSADGSASGVYSPAFSVPAGETYTFSAYVKTGTGAAYIALNDGSITVASETLAANSDWTRLEVSYTNTASSAKNVTARLLTAAAGTTYMDCVQLEKAPTASRYNLIENGDFRHSGSTAYGWTNGGSAGSADKRATASSAAAPELDTNAYTITGAPTALKNVSQTVTVSGSAGDSFVVAGWAKGDAVPVTTYDSNPRAFGIRVIFNYTDGTNSGSTKTAVDFNPDVDSSVSWQYAAAPVVAQKAYSSITVQLVYDYNANTVWFDGIQLYKEEFGNSYTYDSNGNVISVKDLQAQTTQYEYTNNNLTRQTLPTGAKLTYTYDSYHNVISATTDKGVVYNFTYDACGNNTAVSIVSGSVKLTSSASYTADYNRLASTTDAAGKVTSFSYNENTNVLEWVQYPNDTASTRTNYTYDSMYRMASVSANVTGLSSGSALTASYTYTNDNLTAIQTGSTTYAFAYGNFALRSAITIGSRTLASYTYTFRNNYLSSLDYGNGDSVDYTYDKQGRVIQQKYEDGSTVKYLYDNSGALATVTDSATGRTTTYYYDFTDRLLKYVESGSGYSHSVGYEYDNINNLTSLVETINGTRYTTSYTYDADNRVTSVTNGSASEAYTYDAYSRVNQRVTKNGSTTVLTDTFTYRAPTAATTSGQIATLNSSASGYSVAYSYTYDNNGNILSVSDGTNTTSYVYDTANQLTRENNQAAGKTWVWTYDNAGNITSRKEYAYTTGTLGAAVDTVTYTYDTTWGDLLTSYDGKPIESDTIGNMLSDGTWTYTWKHGRQLASMSDGSATWTFTYNSDGLRTRRTNGTATYNYVYNGSSLSQMTVGSDTLNFAYDASGAPMSVSYNGTNYYYATNLQGDVTAILNASGTAVVQYTYDAWGNPLTTSGSMASTLGTLNPLRYRSYVYDQESGLYYLQSRYYSPAIGRFLNADAFAATGQGLLGNNMFAYCGNGPTARIDASGEFFFTVLGAAIGAITGAIDSAMMGGSAEEIAKGALAGAVSGAISGAGVDLGVAVTAATGGTCVAAGVFIAGSAGAIGALVGTGISNDWKGDPLDYAASALVGGMTNMVSFGLAPINGEIGKGAATTIIKEIISEGMNDLAMNVATGTIIAAGAVWITRAITNNNLRTRILTVN